jgi:hypothetical protein
MLAGNIAFLLASNHQAAGTGVVGRQQDIRLGLAAALPAQLEDVAESNLEGEVVVFKDTEGKRFQEGPPALRIQ